MRIGYARVSTEEQNLDLQLAALKEAGCTRIFTDTSSGARLDRLGLREALSHVREDDTVVVWKLDRLGRTVKGLVDLVNQFETQHVHFKSLTDSIDTTTPAGRFFFHVMASLAQMERELLIERTQAGLAAARRQGRVGGRKRLMTEPKVKAAKKLLAAGTPSREWRRTLGCLCPRCTAGCRPGHATDLRLPTYLLQLLRMGGRPSKDDQRRIVGGTERVSRVVLLSRA